MTVRRLKTYAGSQGYVYQYCFVGKRIAASGNRARAMAEYVFDVTTDRKTSYEVSVFLSDEVINAWGERHGRVLSETEQYAAVKLRLFRAFDELESMHDAAQLEVDHSGLEETLSSLGID